MSKKSYQVTERGYFMEIDGKMVVAPVGHTFESESDLSTNNKCRVLEVATPGNNYTDGDLAIRARYEELGGTCGKMRMGTIENKLAELEETLAGDNGE